MTIRSTRTPSEFATARMLFREYADSLPICLCFQGFEKELNTMESMYGPPSGDLLLVMDAKDNPQGCVAIRRMEEGICELKRMYVRPDARSKGRGRVLLEAAIASARNLGYSTMRLDTLESMEHAIRLYVSSGFDQFQTSSSNPDEGKLYMYKKL